MSGEDAGDFGDAAAIHPADHVAHGAARRFTMPAQGAAGDDAIVEGVGGGPPPAQRLVVIDADGVLRLGSELSP